MKKTPWYKLQNKEFWTEERINRHKELKLLYPNKKVRLSQLWTKEDTRETLTIAFISFITTLIINLILILYKVLLK